MMTMPELLIQDGGPKYTFGHLRNIRPAVAEAYFKLGRGIRCMEVGTQHGSHARDICEVLAPSKMVCVDPWCDDDSKAQYGEIYYAKDLLVAVNDRLKPYPYVEYVQQLSQDALPLMNENDFDFIYIDGDHRQATVILDIRNSIRLVRVGGILGGHDYGPKSMFILEGIDCNGEAGVVGAINSVFGGFFVNGSDSDWWVLITPEIKKLIVK